MNLAKLFMFGEFLGTLILAGWLGWKCFRPESLTCCPHGAARVYSEIDKGGDKWIVLENCRLLAPVTVFNENDRISLKFCIISDEESDGVITHEQLDKLLAAAQ